MNRTRILEEKDSLQKVVDDYQREADRSAQHLRNSENIRISELTKQERRLQPSIIVESNDEKRGGGASEFEEAMA
uniref:Uncharacterized protein n=1 Tax=Caenorhabditis tropicalis TaxID=1561998 RepID=A0A1I7U6B2_9PELO